MINMVVNISSDWNRAPPPQVNTSRYESFGGAYISGINVPKTMVGDHRTNIRHGPGTGGSYPVDHRVMVSGVPDVMVQNTAWTQGDFGQYNGGGGLGMADGVTMGPTWFPGPQRGVNYGNVDNRVFVSGSGVQPSTVWSRSGSPPIHQGTVDNRISVSTGGPSNQVGHPTLGNGDVYFTSGVRPVGAGGEPINVGNVAAQNGSYTFVSGAPYSQVSHDRSGGGPPKFNAQHRAPNGWTPNGSYFVSNTVRPSAVPTFDEWINNLIFLAIGIGAGVALGTAKTLKSERAPSGAVLYGGLGRGESD